MRRTVNFIWNGLIILGLVIIVHTLLFNKENSCSLADDNRFYTYQNCKDRIRPAFVINDKQQKADYLGLMDTIQGCKNEGVSLVVNGFYLPINTEVNLIKEAVDQIVRIEYCNKVKDQKKKVYIYSKFLHTDSASN